MLANDINIITKAIDKKIKHDSIASRKKREKDNEKYKNNNKRYRTRLK